MAGHRIEAKHGKLGGVLALDGGQRGDRMYLVHAPNVMKKTRLKLVISSTNYRFCTIKSQLFFIRVGAFDDFF